MRAGPHEWTGDGYYCEVCFGSYHCASCSDSSGSQGHAMMDADGGFFACQEPERAARWQEQTRETARRRQRYFQDPMHE